jgi:cytochrome c
MKFQVMPPFARFIRLSRSRAACVTVFVSIFLPLCTPRPASAQCATEPTADQFKVVTLIEPGTGGLTDNDEGVVQIAVAKDGRVFLAKMQTGEIHVYTGTANQTVLAAKIPTFFSPGEGLVGIALAPDFETAHWLYAMYSDPCGLDCADRSSELARFTVSADNKLSNKKVILRFPRARDNQNHATGGLAFATDGTLVIGTADNTDPHDATNNGYGPVNEGHSTGDAQRTAGNTNDLRGKILRIKPVAFADNQTPAAGIGSTYTIPAGNLFQASATTKPEIYAMGCRNPFSARIDAGTGWIFWGDVGPDASSMSASRGPSGHDEFNLTAAPGNFGHPYCNGYNVPYGAYPDYASKYNCDAPVNNSPNNTGNKNLPPARPALIAYSSGNSTDDDARFNPMHGPETAISGPMYRFNPASASTVKFPAYYEGKIFFMDWSRRLTKFITVNYPAATIPAGAAGVSNFAPQGLPVASYIDAQFAPGGAYEGSLYLARFSSDGYTGKASGLYRVEFNNPAYDNSCYKTFGGSPMAVKISRGAPVWAQSAFTIPAGYRTAEFYDLGGRLLWSYHRETARNEMRVPLPDQLGKGVWRARLRP